MKKINFANNYNGKLLPDFLLTVRLHDGKTRVGQSVEINLRHQPLGIGEVVDVLKFAMFDLPDVIAYMDCGHDAGYLKNMLRRFYKDTTDSTYFDVIAIKWTVRLPNVQRDLFDNAWKKLEENAAA